MIKSASINSSIWGKRRPDGFPKMNVIKLPVWHYKQGTNDYACGPVCIRMGIDSLLTREGKPRLDREAIKRIEHLTMKGMVWSSSGTCPRRMKNAIRRMGFGCREIRGDTDEKRVRNLVRAIDDLNPVILGCIADLGPDRYRHYFVLFGIDDKYIFIRDPYPEGRPSKVRIKEFLKNGKPTSWGNNRWGVEVYLKPKNRFGSLTT